MNEKIENLIEELKKECNKENIGLSLSLVNEETFGMIAAGPANLAVMGALLQGKKYIEIAEGIDSKEDLADVMTRIFKGEFE